MSSKRSAVAVLLLAGLGAIGHAQQPSPTTAPRPEDGQRQPWTRSDERYLRQWLVLGAFAGSLDEDVLAAAGGELNVRPAAGQEVRRADGSLAKWNVVNSYGDAIGLEGLEGPTEGAVAYAATTLERLQAGKALLSIGSDEGLRVWLNGQRVLARDGLRSLTADEDQVEVELQAGANSLLVKVEQQAGAWRFAARVLAPGAVGVRTQEIGPSLVRSTATGFALRSDTGPERSDAPPVTVEIVAPGGRVVWTRQIARGVVLDVDGAAWPDGPYEVRCTTRTFARRLYATHLAWYKGEALPKARELAVAAGRADASRPEGLLLSMLAEMVDDRLGAKVAAAQGNPWRRIHSPLFEYDELMLERLGRGSRIRPHGFVRFAYRDEVDGSPQFCRAYLPAGYDPARKWPLVVQLHGFNPANPLYWRWWSADSRHPGVDTEFADQQGVIYMEPHGRGNTQYRGMGDSDVLQAIAEAKRAFNVDGDRVYLTGDSMGGWGTWNVATRHPELFAALAPVFGGSDYHVDQTPEQIAALPPLARFASEKASSWAMADSLLNLPILVQHGDQDRAVNVEYSRWAVRMLQRWGYDVRYHEYPGRAHEALGHTPNGNLSIEWLLKHRRDPQPRHVRVRSAELRNASAYWARVEQAARPDAFMVVDAEIVGPNLIRLDTQNVLALRLSPPASLMDPLKPIRVVWNGVPQDLRAQDGALRIQEKGYEPTGRVKTPRLPGSMGDFGVTPFALVVGTSAKDPAVAALCAKKASEYVEYWRDWQKHAPRVFKDTEISEVDQARYSLMLIGGPDENRVAARLAGQLPLKVSASEVVIDGQAFVAKDAAVHFLYPNPLNPERYVLLLAGTSLAGLEFADPRLRGLTEWDYAIVDRPASAQGQPGWPWQRQIVSGAFDRHWRYDETLAARGDAEVRAARGVARP